MMKNWQSKRVLIIGAARQGLALAQYLVAKGAQVTLNDLRTEQEMQAVITSTQGLEVDWFLGGHPLNLLEQKDMVCISGGVPLNNPLVATALDRGLPLSNDSQIFLEQVASPVIGITGSAGKTTTTTLVGRMADAMVQLPQRAWVGGNIGTPLVDRLDEIQADDLVVLELSSFQLEIMTLSPQVAAVLNLTPNHLDRHGTMEAYRAAKARILDFQTSMGVAVLNREDPGSWGLASIVNGRLATFGVHRPGPSLMGTFIEDNWLCWQDPTKTERIMPVDQVTLRGSHNLANVLAACAIGLAAGFSREAVQAGVRGFSGVAHRLEFVRTWNGAQWYNDSLATAPERSRAAICAFDEPIVLLLGGRDKNLSWDELASLVKKRVDHLIVFGEATQIILKAMGEHESEQRPYSIAQCTGLEGAVRAASKVVENGDVVLFSPGGTSFDEFIDFEERGEAYRSWVNRLQ